MSEAIDELLQSGVGRGDVPGVVATVVGHDGISYVGGFGERKIGSGVAMTPDTVGLIASMTKPIAGAAVMQLVERGKLDLDAPASAICPELASAVVLEGFDPDANPITRPPKSPITLRHLMTHTSGFVYPIWNSSLARYLEVTGHPSLWTRLKTALRTPIMFDPGTAWEYGTGIDWAGQMVEQVSGLTLGDYLAEHLTGPLEMTDTAFAPTPSMTERAASLHARGVDGYLTPIQRPVIEEPEFEQGGSGLFSTMLDYSRFIQMILNDGELDGVRVLEAATIEQMATNNIGDLRVMPLNTADPGSSNDAEFFPDDPKTWGLTFQINEVPGHTGRPAGTLMWAGLSNCYFWIDRKNGIGGTYLTQILPFADVKSLPLFYEFESAVYNAFD